MENRGIPDDKRKEILRKFIADRIKLKSLDNDKFTLCSDMVVSEFIKNTYNNPHHEDVVGAFDEQTLAKMKEATEKIQEIKDNIVDELTEKIDKHLLGYHL